MKSFPRPRKLHWSVAIALFGMDLSGDSSTSHLHPIKKYACDVKFDPNTAHTRFSFSDGFRKATWMDHQQPYPEHPDRFEKLPQVLSTEGLSGRCYWEVELRAGDQDFGAGIAVAYKSIKRKGKKGECRLGYNNQSWSLVCSHDTYFARHMKEPIAIPVRPSGSGKVGVYLDWPAGSLSFYEVSSDTLTHLHTFHSTFTQPLYPAFWVVGTGTSLSLGQIT